MDSYEHGNQSELYTAQRISSLADTLSFPPPKKKRCTLQTWWTGVTCLPVTNSTQFWVTCCLS